MSIQLIEPDDVAKLILKHPEILLIDVREHSDHASLRMAHSFCVPLAELGSDDFVNEHVTDPMRPILLICLLGKRANMAAQTLQPRLKNPLFVLAGGLTACREAGMALVEETP